MQIDRGRRGHRRIFIHDTKSCGRFACCHGLVIRTLNCIVTRLAASKQLLLPLPLRECPVNHFVYQRHKFAKLCLEHTQLLEIQSGIRRIPLCFPESRCAQLSVSHNF
jgi:hypothetical protein